MEVVRAGAVLLSADNEINGLEFRRLSTASSCLSAIPAWKASASCSACAGRTFAASSGSWTWMATRSTSGRRARARALPHRVS